MIPQPDPGHTSCARTPERVHAQHDGELAPELRAELDAHLAECVRCARAAAAERRFLARLRTVAAAGMGASRAPASLRIRAMAMLRVIA